VAGENQCGTGATSDDLVILLSDTPEPIIAGPAQTCDNTEEIYLAEDHAGNTYDWAVVGGNILEGQGTSQITVYWTNPGQGQVNVTESTPEDCTGVATEVLVTIDNCTGIDINAVGTVSVYPNPVNNELNISLVLNETTEANISIMNAFGQVVYSERLAVSNTQTNLVVNTSNLASGYYLIQVETAGSAVLQQKFVKQ